MKLLRMAPLAILFAAPAFADPAPLASEHRLTPSQIEAALAQAAEQRLSAERATGVAPVDVLDPVRGPATAAPLDLHGSVGVSIGTRGHRSAYGSAVVGLGGTTSVGITLHHSEGRRNGWMIP